MGKSEKEILEELKIIRKLLITNLLALGIDAATLAKILRYKSSSAITNEFPVRKIFKKGSV